MPKALFVEITAKAGAEREVEAFLREALTAVENEPHTRDWYALRFDDSRFAIFDTFEGTLDRLKHLAGKVGRQLVAETVTHLDGLPGVHSSELVAAKLPNGTEQARAAYYAPIETRLGQGRDFGEVLVGARDTVAAETEMLAWYAVRRGPNTYAVLGFLSDAAARAAHLDGPVGRKLREAVGPFLETMPEVRPATVLGAKHSGWLAVTSAEQQMHPEQPVRVAPEPS